MAKLIASSAVQILPSEAENYPLTLIFPWA